MEKDRSDKWLVKIVVVGCKDDLEGWIRQYSQAQCNRHFGHHLL